ncbi:MAG: hypothetical protein C4B59_17365 [Candidatus Methanogaster sp.]|uniref:Uncharacterized protein n=1 Tax=Candidatus Methanogaster sp. TaxID=3386292 RepID=A0AC61KXX6_9EURY|nr:MAG: hypothetical protein C4B59_17365 [ANME-2 cluster archaeon]
MTIWRNYNYNHTHCILNGIILYYQEMSVCMRQANFDRLFFGSLLGGCGGRKVWISLDFSAVPAQV